MFSRRAAGVLLVFAFIVVLSCVANPAIPRGVSSAVSERIASQSTASPHPIADRTFLLLKTGIEVAYTRLPAHFETSMRLYPHHTVYADTSDTVNGMPMVDALAFLDTKTLNNEMLKPYRLRRQASAQHWNWKAMKVEASSDVKGGGWSMDRFKNVPAYAHAFLNNPDFDWYMMMDADSYITTSTLEAMTKGLDPSKPFYLGKAVVSSGDVFAHGGSGIILSRGALQKMFGNSEKSAFATITKASELAMPVCCGDLVLGQVYHEVMQQQTTLEQVGKLQVNEAGQFQGASISQTQVLFSEWCKPVGTFHRLGPWEVTELYDWEVGMGSKPLVYADFYDRFIAPEIIPEKENWIVDYENLAVKKTVYKGNDPEARDKEKCIEACDANPECTMWQFIGNEVCAILNSTVVRGVARNRYSPQWKGQSECTTGYEIDRIQEFRRKQSCGVPENEGSLYRPGVPGEFRVKQAPLKDSDEDEDLSDDLAEDGPDDGGEDAAQSGKDVAHGGGGEGDGEWEDSHGSDSGRENEDGPWQHDIEHESWEHDDGPPSHDGHHDGPPHDGHHDGPPHDGHHDGPPPHDSHHDVPPPHDGHHDGPPPPSPHDSHHDGPPPHDGHHDGPPPHDGPPHPPHGSPRD